MWTCVTPATCSEPQFEYVITPTDHGAVVQVQPAFPPKFELEAAWNSGCRDERRRQSECVKPEGESLVIGSKQTVSKYRLTEVDLLHVPRPSPHCVRLGDEVEVDGESWKTLRSSLPAGTSV